MSKQKHRQLRRALCDAIIRNGNIDEIQRYLNSGVHPGENMLWVHRNSRTPTGSRGLFVQEGRQDDAEYSIFHQAVSHVCKFPDEPSRLTIVKELLARHPDVITTTAQGIVVVPREGQEPVTVGDGLNVLQFFSRLATIYQQPMPSQLTDILVNASMDYALTSRFPCKLLEHLHDDKDVSSSLVDIHIRCSDGITMIPAHRTILMAASRYFQNVLGDSWRDTQDGVWNAQVSPSVMKAIKRFIYMGEFSELSNDTQLQELFVQSHQYGLLDLFCLCEKRLVAILSQDNFATLLVLAGEREEDAKILFSACVKFFRKHSMELHFDESLQRVREDQHTVWTHLEASVLSDVRNESGEMDGCDKENGIGIDD